MKVSRIYRLLKLITMLQQGRGSSPDALAAELEVSRRTIFRDLKMLEMAHIPYHFDPERKSYRIGGQFFLPPVNLTLSEALSVLMLAGRRRGAGRLPLQQHSALAAMKIESVLPRAVRRHVGSVMDKLTFSIGQVSDHSGCEKAFDDLVQAIAGRRICRMRYESLYDKRTLDLDVRPLRLKFVDRGWYLLAYSVAHGEIRTFKLVRILELDILDETFQQPSSDDADDQFGRAWRMIPEGTVYEVCLRFSPRVARNVAEVQWHSTQQLREQPDGSLEFHAQVDGLGEIQWWILGYGDQVEVLDPPELREKVASKVARMAEVYLGSEGRP